MFWRNREKGRINIAQNYLMDNAHTNKRIEKGKL